MPTFFDRPNPQQAVPGDLTGLRDTILRSLTQGGDGGVLGRLLNFTSETNPGNSSLPALRASSDQRLNDQISQLNASAPGRFSTANLYEQGRLRERSQEDFNLLSSQVLERGRDRQLQSILALLGPVFGPTFGGPFTQDPSGFENFLGLANAAGNFVNPFDLGGGK